MTQTHALLADDSFSLRLLLGHALERAGYRVSHAANGEQALATLMDVRPEIAILDVAMPGLDGIAVCRAARAHPSLSRLTIVMMSGDDVEQEALAAGADYFLPKPFLASKLIAVLTQVHQWRKRSDGPLGFDRR